MQEEDEDVQAVIVFPSPYGEIYFKLYMRESFSCFWFLLVSVPLRGDIFQISKCFSDTFMRSIFSVPLRGDIFQIKRRDKNG